MLESAKLMVVWLTSMERQSEPNSVGFASVFDNVNRKTGLDTVPAEQYAAYCV